MIAPLPYGLVYDIDGESDAAHARRLALVTEANDLCVALTRLEIEAFEHYRFFRWRLHQDDAARVWRRRSQRCYRLYVAAVRRKLRRLGAQP